MSTAKKQAPVAKKAEKKKLYEITCKQVVHYQKQMELTEEEFKLLNAVHGADVSERHNQREYYGIQKWIDLHDVNDSNPEFTDFEITKVK